MKLKIVVFLLALCASTLTIAQYEYNQIGHYYDLFGTPFEGFHGPNYIPQKTLNKSYVVGKNYTGGHYYDTFGEKHTGKLKYNQRNSNLKFHYEGEDSFDAKKIKPKFCESYVIGVDSFMTLHNYNVERDLGKFPSSKPDFVEVMDVVGDLSFYRHLHMNQNRILSTYMVQEKNGNLTSFAKGGVRLREAVLKYFGGVPILKKMIDETEIYSSDIPDMIKTYSYYYKYKNNEKIFFDNHWVQLKNEEGASYHALVYLFHPEQVKMKYFHLDGTPIYDGEFISLFPIIKNGVFKWYYPGGSVWKIEEFHDNECAGTTRTFYKNGNLHTELNKTNSDGYDIYKQVYDSLGTALLDENGTGVEVFYDRILNRSIYRNYESGLLRSVFYMDKNNQKIYQVCDKTTRIKSFVTHRNYFDQYRDYPIAALEDYSEWTCLVKFIVEPTGYFSSYEIVSEPNPDFDSYVTGYFDTKKSEKLFSKPKHDKQKVFQEVIVPISFIINSYSRYRIRVHWFYHPYWHHSNSFTLPDLTVPKMPAMHLPTLY